MLLREFIEPRPYVYHGSRQEDLRQLLPKPHRLARRPVVFAATLFDIAVAMAGNWTDDDLEFGHATAGDQPDLIFPPYEIRPLRRNAIADIYGQPCWVYMLPGDTFVSDQNLQDFELFSYEAVDVISSVWVEDPLAILTNSPFVRLMA